MRAVYPVAIHKDPDSDYGVSVPDLSGCISAGSTYAEALAMAREAIELHAAGLAEDGEAVPPPRTARRCRRRRQWRRGWAGAISRTRPRGP